RKRAYCLKIQPATGSFARNLIYSTKPNQRAKLAEEDKKNIAAAAARLIKPGDSLFIDFGTTTLEFTKIISSIPQVTVFTNSPVIANLFHESATTDLILIGGQFGLSKMECVGPVTLQAISSFYADYAIIGAGAISPELGVMDQDINEAAVARQMIKQSNHSVVLADGHKLDSRATSNVAHWKEINCLVTTDPDNKLKKLPFPGHLRIIVA
ncbi:DeoR/GlpR family DNA-binding transcription regulator, partial [Klebsiella quasipneumoniae]|uniref:DeoR/GlpR family DNA-binding transcription regulator n=1 Tax=Klebsiella quasipneumoniae TaxID=1463165 RepID=UPI000AB733C1